jgi:chorismate--pyruvate lyase
VNISEPTWQLLTSDLSIQLKVQLGPALWEVLSDTGSLTDIVKRDCSGSFSVTVLSQTEERPAHSEASYLGLQSTDSAVLRNVLLCDDGTPLVFAHSVMPLKTLEGAGEVLGNMGSKPLGAELFSNPLIRRGDIQITALAPSHPIFASATSSIPQGLGLIWGRRSMFFVGENPLLVCEFFLPSWRPVSPS